MSDNSLFITVTTYDAFHKIVKAFSKGTIPLLLIVGEPGVSKSKSVKKALNGKGKWIEGKATAVAIYSLLYQYRNEMVIFDDVNMHNDDNCRRLLKCLCQTDPIKTLNWHSQNKVLREAGIPNEFDTSSHVCIVVNEWDTLSEDVSAVEDRAVAIRFEPTMVEVHRQVAAWFDDQEVFDHIGTMAHLVAKPSMRHYLFAKNCKRSGLDWKAMTVERVCDKDILHFYRVASADLATEADKVKLWVKSKYGSRAKYFRTKKRMQAKEEMPKIKVRGKAEKKVRVSKSQPPATAGTGLRVVGIR